jgi:hypothetical protein
MYKFPHTVRLLVNALVGSCSHIVNNTANSSYRKSEAFPTFLHLRVRSGELCAVVMRKEHGARLWAMFGSISQRATVCRLRSPLSQTAHSALTAQ